MSFSFVLVLVMSAVLAACSSVGVPCCETIVVDPTTRLAWTIATDSAERLLAHDSDLIVKRGIGTRTIIGQLRTDLQMTFMFEATGLGVCLATSLHAVNDTTAYRDRVALLVSAFGPYRTSQREERTETFWQLHGRGCSIHVNLRERRNVDGIVLSLTYVKFPRPLD